MSINLDINQMKDALENELRQAIIRETENNYLEIQNMLNYHFGWETINSPKPVQGKRLRPILLMLSTQAAGGNWHNALTAATAVEMLHNFSLIHDDIQDNSSTRWGRSTLWVKWGIAQAINSGDFLFSLAYQSLLKRTDEITSEEKLVVAQIFNETCLNITKGQYLDISFETKNQISVNDYLEMIGGKTAALISCSAELGAVSARANKNIQNVYKRFGYLVGLGFQIWDDWLGIWGNAGDTGKSVENDLVTGKKILPVIYGLEKRGKFANRWSSGPIALNEVDEIANLLIDEGAKEYTELMADRYIQDAVNALEDGIVSRDGGDALKEFVFSFVKRKK